MPSCPLSSGCAQIRQVRRCRKVCSRQGQAAVIGRTDMRRPAWAATQKCHAAPARQPAAWHLQTPNFSFKFGGGGYRGFGRAHGFFWDCQTRFLLRLVTCGHLKLNSCYRVGPYCPKWGEIPPPSLSCESRSLPNKNALCADCARHGAALLQVHDSLVGRCSVQTRRTSLSGP